MLSMSVAIVITILGSTVVALPLGLACAVAMVMVLRDKPRLLVGHSLKILSGLPTITIGIMLLVIMPQLQLNSSHISIIVILVVGSPMFIVGIIIICDILTSKTSWEIRRITRPIITTVIMIAGISALVSLSQKIGEMAFPSVRNAMALSLLIGFMAIPTVIHVSADSLSSAVSRFRSASYALGATRSETLAHILIPASRRGILGALFLGTTRSITEIMAIHLSGASSSVTAWSDQTADHLEFILKSVIRVGNLVTGEGNATFSYPDIPVIFIIATTTIFGELAARHTRSRAARSMMGDSVAS